MSKKFTPPLYGKLAKSVKDLFKKKYDFDHQVKLINKASNGVTIESGSVASDSAAVKGFVKGTYAASEFETEVEVWTADSNESKATVKLTKLADGLTVTLGGSTKDKDKDFKSSLASIDLEYRHENISLQDVIKSDFHTTKLEATAVAGYEGVALGGQVVADLTSGVKVADYNIGLEWAQRDLTASLWTEKSASVISAALYQKPSVNQVLGAIFKYDTAKNTRALQIGGEYRVDADTTVRAKFELPDGTASAVVEHRLANPALLLQVAARFAAKPTLTAQKLGVTVSLGDF